MFRAGNVYPARCRQPGVGAGTTDQWEQVAGRRAGAGGATAHSPDTRRWGGWWQPPLAPRPWRDHFLRQLYCTVLYCTGRCVLCTCTYWHCTMVGRRLEAGGGGAEQTRRTTIRMPEKGTKTWHLLSCSSLSFISCMYPSLKPFVAAWPNNDQTTAQQMAPLATCLIRHQNSSYRAAVNTHRWGFSPLKRSIAETKRKMCRCVDSVDSAGCCQCQRGNRSDTWDTNYRQHRSRGKQSQMEQIIDNVWSRYLIDKPDHTFEQVRILSILQFC